MTPYDTVVRDPANYVVVHKDMRMRGIPRPTSEATGEVAHTHRQS